MKQNAILITGANGEVGHGLIRALGHETTIVTLDLTGLASPIDQYVDEPIPGSILDTDLLHELGQKYHFTTIYHLAAVLSTHGERSPFASHEVNVQGTINLLRLAVEQAGPMVKFLFPSSIAVYGLPGLDVKQVAGAILETDYNQPRTMYGCNKLYCENLGAYFGRHYHQSEPVLDFRALRFPGLISTETIPTGGTSDYAPEMLHAAARNEPYTCFVRPNTTLPFMTMPDAIHSLLNLSAAPRENLSRAVYNVAGFSLSAAQISETVKAAFPEAKITFDPAADRQQIVDGWPTNIDDTLARTDWHWQPMYNASSAFQEYLIPGIKAHYSIKEL